MFRRSDGTKGFSWMRMVDNSFPVMRMIHGPNDPEHISVHQRDAVYTGQVTPRGISYGLLDSALYVSGIMASESEAKKVYKKLQKTGVVAQDGTVDTTKIDGSFTHQLATLPAPRQKQIVDLLFFFEEEVRRLRNLSGEKEELKGLVESTADPGQRQVYAQLLERVTGKIRAKPSERVEAVERDEDELMVNFRNGTIRPKGQQRGDERLPEYSPRS